MKICGAPLKTNRWGGNRAVLGQFCQLVCRTGEDRCHLHGGSSPSAERTERNRRIRLANEARWRRRDLEQAYARLDARQRQNVVLVWFREVGGAAFEDFAKSRAYITKVGANATTM